ncbi:MAG TPA: molecular chaperone DnaK [Planctomycetaceae bacterium]|nr:molecular chaperone DnaK [Planctomycetaceae bacterium]HRE99862.1 TraR/DksA family transcriptional regulator [Pirellulaceae bacterium]
MSRKESLAELHEILKARREAIRMALLGDMSLLNELASQTKGDVVDWALDSAQDELSSQLAEVEGRELAMIDNALKRMSSGEYGECEVCEQPIPLARLQALPYATLCVGCQRAAEISGGSGGRTVDWSRVVDFPSDDSRARDIDINVP